MGIHWSECVLNVNTHTILILKYLMMWLHECSDQLRFPGPSLMHPGLCQRPLDRDGAPSKLGPALLLKFLRRELRRLRRIIGREAGRAQQGLSSTPRGQHTQERCACATHREGLSSCPLDGDEERPPGVLRSLLASSI